MFKKILRISLIVFVLFLCGCVNEIMKPKENKELSEDAFLIEGYLEIQGELLKVNFYDNKTTRELIQNLPVSIVMNDLNGNEKYYYFDQSFTTNSERVENIRAGDLLLFGDNCLVIFYEDYSTNYAYTRLGYIVDNNHLDKIFNEGNIEIKLGIK